MKCKVIVLGLTLVMALSLTGCGSKDTSTMSEPVGVREPTESIGEEGASTGRVAFRVRYLYPSGKLAKSAVVDKMIAYVYEPDGTEITHEDLRREGDRGKASITVSAGDDRRVDLVAYDGSLVKWTGSDLDVDVVAGETTTAEIVMESTIPILADLPDTTTTGSYTVSWGGVPGGTTYTLQENETAVYAGADTFSVVTGKGKGSYSYCIKATIGNYGGSPWSTVKSIVVVDTTGTIDIDIPWPLPSFQDGRIEVLNIVNATGSTRVPMHVSYVNSDGETIETVVAVGEQKLVTGDDILEGGTTVKLVFRPEMNCYVVAEKEVTIDGNIIVRIPYIGPCGSGVVTIEAGPKVQTDDDSSIGGEQFGEISGTVTFVGTWLETGDVQVSIWASFPPAGPPAGATEPLASAETIQYKIEGLTKATYPVVTVGWRDPNNPMGGKILGVYWAQTDSLGVDGTGQLTVQPIPIEISDANLIWENVDIKANLDIAP